MKTPYTYSVLRYVHDTVSGEFINVGVALLAPEARYAGAICRPTFGRLSKVFPGMDGEAFKRLMRHIQSRFARMGDELATTLPFETAPKSILELAYAVLPPDDSSLQWTPAGSGLTENPASTLESLFDRMVMAYEDGKPREGRSDDEVWTRYKHALESHHALKFLKPKLIQAPNYDKEFQFAWKNGVWHCLEPVSLDLSRADSITEKAHRWLGQITSLGGADEPFKVYLLLGRPQRAELDKAYDNARNILAMSPVGSTRIVPEEEAEAFSETFAKEMAAAHA